MHRLLPDDERHLRRALALASEAAPFASPNPTVGCVLTSPAGEVIGEGAHLYDRRDHAEIAAMKAAAAAGHDLRGAVAYVSLEPCTVQGRTGPCADALIAAGIARCVVATTDPNPQVAGRGLDRLRQAGIAVELLPAASELAQQARRRNDGFAFAIRHGRPFVTLKAAISVDGKLAPPSHLRSGNTPHWLTGAAAREDVQRLRHASDAVITGIGTVLADNPALTDRTGLPRRRPLLRVILDSDLRTPGEAQLLHRVEQDLLFFCAGGAPMAREDALRERGAQVVRIATDGDGRLNLNTVLQTLDSAGMRSVMVEAGSAVNGSFLGANLADKLVLYVADIELGSEAVDFAAGPSPYVLQTQLSGLTRAVFPNGNGEDIRLAGYLHDPWSGV